MKSFDIACKITLFPTNVKGFLDNLWLFFDNIRYALADFYGDGLYFEPVFPLGDFQSDDTGFAVYRLLGVEDEVADAVVDTVTHKLLDGL